MLPKGISVDPATLGLEFLNLPPGLDCRIVKLLRALYGLKQAPQLWNKKLNETLTGEQGSQRATADTCLYYYKDSNGFVILVAEVDDLIVTGTNQAKIEQLHRDLVEKRKASQFEPVNSFLGIDIQYNIQSFADVGTKAGELTMNVRAKLTRCLIRTQRSLL